MHWTYDISVGALYLSVRDAAVSSQREFDVSVVLDLDHAGQLVGIEVLSSAGRQRLLERIEELGLDEAAQAFVVSVVIGSAGARGDLQRVNDDQPVASDDTAATIRELTPI
jgi:uncharacterized protein YuzE